MPRIIQIDRELLLSLVNYAESRGMQARLDAITSAARAKEEPTVQNVERAEIDAGVANRICAAVQRADLLLYPERVVIKEAV